MCFGGLFRVPRAEAVKTVTQLIPSFAPATLEGCTVGVLTCARTLLLHVRLTEGAAGCVAAGRLAFWTACAGGVARRLGEASAARDREHRACARGERPGRARRRTRGPLGRARAGVRAAVGTGRPCADGPAAGAVDPRRRGWPRGRRLRAVRAAPLRAERPRPSGGRRARPRPRRRAIERRARVRDRPRRRGWPRCERA